MPLLEPHPTNWAAIEQRHMIRLRYHGKDCILEPHDHGILKGSVQLLSYQVGGSSSRPIADSDEENYSFRADENHNFAERRR